MKHTLLRLSVGAFTFLMGIYGVYLAYLQNRKSTELLPPAVQLRSPESVQRIATSPDTTYQFKSVKEEFEETAERGGCTFDSVYYSPAFESQAPRGGDFGPFISKRWVEILRRDKDTTVPFLISQIPDRSRTNVHIDPFDMATKGELAVYWLQFVLKTNWYDLTESYRKRYDTINFEYTNPQALLQRIISTKRGAAEMMNLWKHVSEDQP